MTDTELTDAEFIESMRKYCSAETQRLLALLDAKQKEYNEDVSHWLVIAGQREKEVARLAAENERLRTVLQAIVDDCITVQSIRWPPGVDLMKWARDALKAQP